MEQGLTDIRNKAKKMVAKGNGWDMFPTSAETIVMFVDRIESLEEALNHSAGAVLEYDRKNRKLKNALNDLLDGLDANNDERGGLSNEEWLKRIENAWKALK